MASLVIMTVLTATVLLVVRGCVFANEVTVNALLGSEIVLQCDQGIGQGDVAFAQWFKDPQSVPIAQKFNDKLKVSAKYNLTTNYSLVISDVVVADEARYKCFVSPRGLQNDYEGFVILRVSGYPDESASLIEGCGESDIACRRTVVVGVSVVVMCRARDVYPEILPQWTNPDIVDGSKLSRTATENPDGTYTTSSAINFDVDTVFETELTCTFEYRGYVRSSSILILATKITTTAQDDTNKGTDNSSTPPTPTSTKTAIKSLPSSVVIGVAVGVTLPLIVIVIAVVLVLLIKKNTISCKRCFNHKEGEKDKKDGDVRYTKVCLNDKEEEKASLNGKDGIIVHTEVPMSPTNDKEEEKAPPDGKDDVKVSMSAREKRAAFRAKRQETILDDYKLKT